MFSSAKKPGYFSGQEGINVIAGMGVGFFFLTGKSLGISLFVLAFAGIYYALANRKNENHFSWRDGKLIIFVSCIPAAYFFRMLFSDFDQRSLDKALRLLFIIPIFWIIRAYGISAAKFLMCISAGVLVAGLDSAVQIANGAQRVTSSSVANPIPFGNFALLFGVLGLLQISSASENRASYFVKFLCIFGFISGLLTSVASGSRGGWLAIPVFVAIFWGFFCKINQKKNYILFFAFLTIIALGLYSIPPVGGRLMQGFDEARDYLIRPHSWASESTYTSIGGRLDLWAAGLGAFKSAPIFGLGFSGFNEYLHFRVGEGLSHPALESFKHLHCEIITTAAKLGLMGIAALAVFWVGGVRWFMWGSDRNQPNKNIFRIMGLVTFAAMIVFSLTDSMFGMTVHVTVYTLLIGIFSGGLRHSELAAEKFILRKRNAG
jgi:O-antigen ligase